MKALSTFALAVVSAQSVLASSDSKCTADTAPQQLHFNYAGSTGMMVSWNTPGKLDRPSVKYGKGSALDKVATSDVSVTYDTSTTYNNHVMISGLEADTEYSFLVLCGKASEKSTFKTSLPAGSGKPFKFAFYGDLGTMGHYGLSTTSPGPYLGDHYNGSIESNTIIALRKAMDDFEFIWHDGDLAYADYSLTEQIADYHDTELPSHAITKAHTAVIYEDILNAFYREMATVTAHKPWMVGPGNHEANCDDGGLTDPTTNVTYTYKFCVEGQRNFTGFRNHFRMPSAESGGLENFWYSWDYGMVHFVQFNTETDFPYAPDESCGPGDNCAGPFAPRGTQLDWLKADLAAVDRSKTPWIIAAGHRPWYASGQVCWACQDAFEDIFLQHDVDVALFGHQHFFERNTPIKYNHSDPAGLNNPTAPWYLVSGAAGHYDGLDNFTLPLQKYQEAGFDTVYGYSTFTVHNCTHLTHDFIASNNGSVLDSATLYKKRSCSVTS